MLILREEQMAALARVPELVYLERLSKRLLAEGLWRHGRPGPKRFVQEAVQQARGLGLVTTAAVERFVLCLARRGPALLTDEPWAREIAQAADLSPEEKLLRLETGP